MLKEDEHTLPKHTLRFIRETNNDTNEMNIPESLKVIADQLLDLMKNVYTAKDYFINYNKKSISVKAYQVIASKNNSVNEFARLHNLPRKVTKDFSIIYTIK